MVQTRKYKKRSPSKTRRGRKNFITHKGSKKYNRRGHRQSRNSRGRKGKPYTKKMKGGNTTHHKPTIAMVPGSPIKTV